MGAICALYKDVAADGLELDDALHGQIIKLAVQAGHLDHAREICMPARYPDPQNYQSLICACGQEGPADLPTSDEIDSVPPTSILLKVKDPLGSEVHFRIKPSTPLRKLMDAYCSRLRVLASSTCFMVAGMRISPEDTALKLRLVNEDLIDVVPCEPG